MAPAGGAGGGGGGEAAQVGDPPAGQQRADGVALPRLLEGGQDLGEQPGAGSSTSVRIDRRPAAACGTARPRPGSAGSARRGGVRRPIGRGSRGRRRPGAAAPRRCRHTARAASSSSSLAARPEHLLAQLAAGPVEAHLGRRLGDAELGGDGLVGQVVDVAQHDDGGGRSSRARRAPRAGPAASASARGRVVVGARSSTTGVVVELVVAVRAPAEVGGGAVGRDPVQPRRELGVAAEALEPPVGPQVRPPAPRPARPPRCPVSR